MDVLLVEDHQEVRAALAELLEVEGYRVTAVANAEDALAHAQAGAYSLLVADQALPGKPGSWLVTEARARRGPTFPALIITAGPEVPRLDGVRVLFKPMDLDEFIAAVRALTRGAPSATTPAAPPTVARAHLRLYVSSGAAPSARALTRLREALADYRDEDLKLEIFDFAQGVPPEAEEDRVLGTPALRIDGGGAQRTWLMGDLARLETLRLLLDAAGVRRRGAGDLR